MSPVWAQTQGPSQNQKVLLTTDPPLQPLRRVTLAYPKCLLKSGPLWLMDGIWAAACWAGLCKLLAFVTRYKENKESPPVAYKVKIFHPLHFPHSAFLADHRLLDNSQKKHCFSSVGKRWRMKLCKPCECPGTRKALGSIPSSA